MLSAIAIGKHRQGELRGVMHLLVNGFPHAFEDPDNPPTLGNFGDYTEREIEGLVPVLPAPRAAEELEEPFREAEQPEVVLLRNLCALRLYVLEQ